MVMYPQESVLSFRASCNGNGFRVIRIAELRHICATFTGGMMLYSAISEVIKIDCHTYFEIQMLLDLTIEFW